MGSTQKILPVAESETRLAWRDVGAGLEQMTDPEQFTEGVQGGGHDPPALMHPIKVRRAGFGTAESEVLIRDNPKIIRGHAEIKTGEPVVDCDKPERQYVCVGNDGFHGG